MQARIVDPVDPALIEKELTDDSFLRTANKGGGLLYVVDAHTAPNTMREIGRLREITFRAAGGGTGLDCDIDSYDTMTPPCRQLVVWNKESRQIMGGYRFIHGSEVALENGVPRIATSHMFRFSDKFLSEYLPYTIELGRSFVVTEYQSSRAGAKALFALDNLWDGLGALTVKYPDIKYLFGKMTMYPDYPRQCRDMILFFLHKHFPDTDNLIFPFNPLVIDLNRSDLCTLFSGLTFKDDYRILNAAIRNHGMSIPPLVNAYMNLSPTMRTFGTAVNDLFGDVEETGILISIADIFEEKKNRHIQTYTPRL